MTVYTVALPKGGTTKTTTAAEVVAELARCGRRVLAVDVDRQGNLTSRMGVGADSEVAAVAADVLVGEASAVDAAIEAPSVPGAWVLVGTHHLASLDQRPEVITALRDHLPEPEVSRQWDDVVIDTPPALGLVTLAALAAADVVIAAVACETEAVQAVGEIVHLIRTRVAPRLRPGQQLHWIVPTRFDGRRRLDNEVVDTLQEHFPGRVTKPIREAVAARDAFTAGMPVTVYDPRSGIADDYREAIATIMETTDQTGRTEETKETE